MNVSTLMQMQELMTVLNNTKKKLEALQQPQATHAFSQAIIDAQRPAVQSAAAKSVTVTPEPKKRCLQCGAEIEKGALCSKCARKNMGPLGVISDATLKDIYIKEKLINGIH